MKEITIKTVEIADIKNEIQTVFAEKKTFLKKILYCIIGISIILGGLWFSGGIYAVNNAFAHADLTKEQVSLVRFEFEFDDFIPQYEVSWHQNRSEIEYTVHAFTGQLLKID